MQQDLRPLSSSSSAIILESRSTLSVSRQLLVANDTSNLPCSVSVSWGNLSVDNSQLYCLPLLSALNQQPYKQPGSSLAFTLQLPSPTASKPSQFQCTYVSLIPVSWTLRQSFYSSIGACSPFAVPSLTSQASGSSGPALDCTDVIVIASSCSGTTMVVTCPKDGSSASKYG